MLAVVTAHPSLQPTSVATIPTGGSSPTVVETLTQTTNALAAASTASTSVVLIAVVALLVAGASVAACFALLRLGKERRNSDVASAVDKHLFADKDDYALSDLFLRRCVTVGTPVSGECTVEVAVQLNDIALNLAQEDGGRAFVGPNIGCSGAPWKNGDLESQPNVNKQQLPVTVSQTFLAI